MSLPEYFSQEIADFLAFLLLAWAVVINWWIVKQPDDRPPEKTPGNDPMGW